MDCTASSSSGSISRFVALLNRALHLIDSWSACLSCCQCFIDFIFFLYTREDSHNSAYWKYFIVHPIKIYSRGCSVKDCFGLFSKIYLPLNHTKTSMNVFEKETNSDLIQVLTQHCLVSHMHVKYTVCYT